MPSRRERLGDLLQAAFAPSALEVHDESHTHSVRPGAETHFRVVVVSDRFAAASRVQRHRLVHEAVASELAAGLHALAITAVTPEEWAARGGVGPASPVCMGGSKGEAAGTPATLGSRGPRRSA